MSTIAAEERAAGTVTHQTRDRGQGEGDKEDGEVKYRIWKHRQIQADKTIVHVESHLRSTRLKCSSGLCSMLTWLANMLTMTMLTC